MLEVILDQQFVEVVIAPVVERSAVEVAKRKKNVRLLSCGEFVRPRAGMEYKRVGGGLLVQDRRRTLPRRGGAEGGDPAGADRGGDGGSPVRLEGAWFVKSNAIVYARERQTVGVGAGQMSRVDERQDRGAQGRARRACPLPGAVMASDAFFPFRDGIDAAAEAGIAAVIQPGGSMRDDEVIAAADEHGLAMVFTGRPALPALSRAPCAGPADPHRSVWQTDAT